MRKCQCVGLVPIEREMRRIGRYHAQKRCLIGILKAQLHPEPVRQRQPVIGDIARIDRSILIRCITLNNVTAV